MADDYQQAATGPLQGGGGTPVTPQGPNQGILDKLLPIVIPALAGMATTSKWAGPGAAIARGATAGLAGYESQKPKELTAADRYHLALADKYETANRIAQEQFKRQDEFLKSLPPDERNIAAADIPGYIKLKRDERLRGPLIDYLTQRYPDQISPEMVAGLDNAHLQALGNGLTRDEFRAKQRGDTKEYKPLVKDMLVDPDTLQPLGPNDDPAKGVNMHMLISPMDGRVIAPIGRADKPKDADPRLDKSYQAERGRLTKLIKPVEDQAERMNRLVQSVNQRTPQADALIAPELLTAMAGGMGSGLRMNEAEISRIVGGRSKWESLQATLNQWKTDPSKAVSITDPQREQIRGLIDAMNGRIQKRLKVGHDAAEKLVDAKTVEEHRKILNDAEEQLTAEPGAPPPAESDPLGIR